MIGAGCPWCEAEKLRAVLRDVSIWLHSALKCKSWVWDSDQRLAAEECLAQARGLLPEAALLRSAGLKVAPDTQK